MKRKDSRPGQARLFKTRQYATKPAKFEPAKTKYPFEALINGRPVIVWPDWFEYPDDDPLSHLGQTER